MIARCGQWLLGGLLAIALPAQARVDLVVPAAGAVQFGDEFVLEVRRTAPRGSVFAPFAAERLAPLRAGVPARRVVAAATPGDDCEILAFPVRCLQVGDVVLPPFADAVQLADGRAVEVPCAGLLLQVASVLPEPPGELEWPHDGREAAGPASRLPWWLAGGLAAVVALGFVARRRAAPAVVASSPVAVDPAARAQAQLAALDVDGDVLGFHAALAEIVREFLAARRGAPVQHLTSEELARLHPQPAGAVQACLLACDLVKFAAHRPDHAARRAALAAAAQVIGRANDRTTGFAAEPEASA